ncbi:DNA polymerase III subunit delta [Virgibacillus sp. W0430]|uniref:DNA polymerase III subunit delta n=1 Tax=Virgibacillus sp. W0430 TaxID=3391580 RepID=UPI003F48CB19
MLSFEDAWQNIKNKSVPHVVLLYGEEAYFTTNIRQHIQQTVALECEVETVEYDLRETSIQDIITDAETYPFFGEKKVVFAENALFLKSKQEKIIVEHDIKKLERYVNNPVDYTTLVLIAPYEKLDERKRIVKLLKSAAMTVVCQPIKETDIHRWIKKIAEQLSIRLEKDAIDLLALELSTDLFLIKNELAKLALYTGEGGIVSKEIAETLVSHTINQSAIKLTEAVMEKDLHKAIQIYKDLEKMKEEPIAILGLLAYQFRIIMQVKLLKKKGYNQFQMQKQLKVHPYVVKVAYKRESFFTMTSVKEIISNLTITDAAIKQGKMDKNIAFELLLFRLTQPA